MKIAVCIKAVILETPDKIIERSMDVMGLNPYDRPAIELALQLREEHGGEAVAISMGPPDTEDTLLETIAMGIDRAVLLSDPAMAGSDTLATSNILAAGINRAGPFDLVLFGARTSDSDTGQVGPQTSEALGLPMVTYVTDVAVDNDKLTVKRKADDHQAEFEVSSPAALTVHASAFEPRDVPFGGIEEAYADNGLIERLSVADLGLDPGSIGLSGSPTRVGGMKKVVKSGQCEFLEGSVEEQSEKLLELLLAEGLLE